MNASTFSWLANWLTNALAQYTITISLGVSRLLLLATFDKSRRDDFLLIICRAQLSDLDIFYNIIMYISHKKRNLLSEERYKSDAISLFLILD